MTNAVLQSTGRRLRGTIHGYSYADQQQEVLVELRNLPSDPEGSVAAF